MANIEIAARLVEVTAISPDEVVEHEEARLRSSLAKMEQHNGSRLRRFALWRYLSLMAMIDSGALGEARAYAVVSFIFRCLQIATVFIWVFEDLWTPLIALTVVGLFQFIHYFDAQGKLDPWIDFTGLGAHVIHTFVLPLMPIVRLIDLATTFIPHRLLNSYSEEQVLSFRTALAQFEPAAIVRGFYLRQIDAIQEHYLGESSVLRTAQREQQGRFEKVQSSKLLVGRQLADTMCDDDQERRRDLHDTLRLLDTREAEIANELEKMEHFSASTQALIETCKLDANRIDGRLRDKALKKQVLGDTEEHERSLMRSREALAQTYEGLRQDLLNLAAAMSSAPKLLPSSDMAQDTDALLKRVDDMSTKLAEME